MSHWRPLLWAGFWSLSAQAFVDHVFGWGVVAQLLVGFPAVFLALRATAHESVRWRWTYLRHRPPIDERIIFDEDMKMWGVILPGESLCCVYDNTGVDWAHIHTRSLLTGREFIRAETRWR